MAFDRPTKIGKYDVIDIIGRGGMAVVYKATDPYLDRLVAIKMIIGGYADNPDLLKRFFREAQSTGSLQHPNIVTVYELGDHQGNPYLVMEFLEGESLDAMISGRRPLNLLEKVNLVIDVCHGLSYAHGRGVVHRDIKPANIMVMKNAAVKIVDFGIAHIGDKSVTRTGQIMGSLNYMSPEQVNGKPVDARTDIFSTGIVLYQLLTYALPFDGESTASTLLKIIHEPPPALSNYLTSFPPELETVVLRSLAKDREERYQSADDLALDLGQLAGQLKQEMISLYLGEARTLLERADLYKAKEHLVQVLKIDRQHTQATHLLREVQQRIQREQTEEQVRQLRREAEDAYRQEQFETAMGHLDRALGLDPQNAGLRSLRESVRTDWNRAKKLQNAIKHAEVAHRDGELDRAKKAIEDAMELEPNDTRAKALYRAIHRDWVERSRQQQVDNYVIEARKEIASRRFTAALDILKQAEALDPSAPQIRALKKSATAGQAQEHRRRDLEEINKQIEEALDRDDFNTACAKADEGLQRFPEERALLNLKALAEQQKQLAQRKQFVDEQLAYSRKLLDEGRSEELVGVLEAALEKLGSEPRLQSLLLIVRENVKREQFERRKTEYLQKAKDALRRKAYDEAIQTLELGRGELKDAVEIQDLLQFTREEAAAAKRRETAEAAADKAHALMAEQEYAQAIRLLETTLQEIPDPELTIILAEARRAAEEYNRKLESAAATAEKLLLNRKAGEALKFLDTQPGSLAKHPAIQKLVRSATIEAERLRAIDDGIAQARNRLAEENYDSARRVLEECRRAHGSTPELEEQLSEIAARQSAAASGAMQKALADGRMLFMATEYRAAVDRLAQVTHFTSLVPGQMRAEYDKLYAQASAGAARQRRAQIENYIAAGEFTNASDLLNQTLTEFPNSRELAGLEESLRVETARRREAQQALAAAQNAFRNSAWDQGSELLKKALAAAERAPAMREQILNGFVKAAETALGADWRSAEALLRELAQVQPKYAQPAGLQMRIAEAKREEFVGQWLARVQQLRSAGDLAGALRELERGLAVYPDESQLKSAQRNLQQLIRQEEEKARQERARMEREAFLQDALVRSEREASLDNRLRVLEEALQRYPQESRLERQLNFLQELAKRVDGIVKEAQGRERAETYDAALEQWSILRSIYPQYPGLDREVARVQQLQEQRRLANRADWLQKIQNILVTGDYERASAALQDAQREFPGERAFAEIEKRLQERLRLRGKAQKVLVDAEKAFSKKQWQKGTDRVRRACEVAQHDPVIREQSLLFLLHASESLIETDWQSAEMLADHVAELQPTASMLIPVRAKIAASKRNQIVSQCADRAARAQAAGDLQGALQELASGLLAYPGEPSLLLLKTQSEARIQEIAEEQRRQQELEKERQRQLEIERQKELERRQKEEAAARQRQLERTKREEQEAKQRELERQREAELRRERERQLEAKRQLELEERRRQEDAARRKELERQQREAAEARHRELQRKQREEKKAREREIERRRQEELQREQALQLEAKRLEESRRHEAEALEQQLERKRQQEEAAERAKALALEQEKAQEPERQKQRVLEVEQEHARKRAQKAEKQREREQEAHKLRDTSAVDRDLSLRAGDKGTQAKAPFALPEAPDESGATRIMQGASAVASANASEMSVVEAPATPAKTPVSDSSAPSSQVTVRGLAVEHRRWAATFGQLRSARHKWTLGFTGALLIILCVWVLLPGSRSALMISGALPGSRVTINGQSWQVGADGKVSIRLKAGKYRVRVTKDGFQALEQQQQLESGKTVELNVSQRPQPLELPPPTVSARKTFLVIDTGQNDVEIFLDNKPLGGVPVGGVWQIPLRQLRPGHHEIRAEKKGYISELQNVEVAKDTTPPPIVFRLKPAPKVQPTRSEEPAKPALALLMIQGAPAGTTVFVDGKMLGVVEANGTFNSSALPPGKHTVELQSEGYAASRQITQLAAGRETVINGAMEKIPVDNETPAWRQVQNSRDVFALQDFENRFPNGEHKQGAEDRIEDIVKNLDETELEKFIVRYPNAPAANLARARLEDAHKARALAQDRNAIRQVLDQYQQAYSRMDLNAISSLWPSWPASSKKALQTKFKESLSVTLDLQFDLPKVEGNIATVSGTQTLKWTKKDQSQSTNQYPFKINLEKQAGHWIILKGL